MLSCSNRRPELIPINQHPLGIRVRADLARHHLHRHANLHRLFAQVGQLGGHHRPLFQFYQRHGVGQGLFKARRGVVHHGEGINLPFTAESILVFGLAPAVLTYIARREDFCVAVRANFAHQGVALFFQSPMTRYFHDNYFSWYLFKKDHLIEKILLWFVMNCAKFITSRLSNPISPAFWMLSNAIRRHCTLPARASPPWPPGHPAIAPVSYTHLKLPT